MFVYVVSQNTDKLFVYRGFEKFGYICNEIKYGFIRFTENMISFESKQSVFCKKLFYILGQDISTSDSSCSNSSGVASFVVKSAIVLIGK